MTRVLFSLLFFFFNLVELNAQHFEHYVSHVLCEEERLFRFFKIGLIVLDDNGRELRRTELLYDRVKYCDGFDRAVVSLPLISLESDHIMRPEKGHVLICLDFNLEPVFVFPDNADHVYKIVDGMFLYKDKIEHSSTVGLVDKDGKVIFKAPYERIYLENDMCIGVKDVTDDNYSGIKSWVIEFKRKNSEALHVIRLLTPENTSRGLWYEAKDKEDEDEFETILKENPFQRGLNHAVHLRINDAVECFKEALNNADLLIVRCATYNIEMLELWSGTQS